jgi:hypothetical protein
VEPVDPVEPVRSRSPAVVETPEVFDALGVSREDNVMGFITAVGPNI